MIARHGQQREIAGFIRVGVDGELIEPIKRNEGNAHSVTIPEGSYVDFHTHPSREKAGMSRRERFGKVVLHTGSDNPSIQDLMNSLVIQFMNPRKMREVYGSEALRRARTERREGESLSSAISRQTGINADWLRREFHYANRFLNLAASIIITPHGVLIYCFSGDLVDRFGAKVPEVWKDWKVGMLARQGVLTDDSRQQYIYHLLAVQIAMFVILANLMKELGEISFSTYVKAMEGGRAEELISRVRRSTQKNRLLGNLVRHLAFNNLDQEIIYLFPEYQPSRRFWTMVFMEWLPAHNEFLRLRSAGLDTTAAKARAQSSHAASARYLYFNLEAIVLPTWIPKPLFSGYKFFSWTQYTSRVRGLLGGRDNISMQ